MAYSYGNHEVYRYWSNGLKCDRVKRISKKEIYMKTEIVKIDEEQIDQEAIARAGEILKRGGLVAFPTETVYGLGGDALNENSSRLIYAAKGRPSDNPLIVHITNMEALKKIVTEIPPAARKLAERYWPGPLTMIFHKSSAVPLATTGGLDTVAVRMPSHKTARAMIDAAGGYIAAPSANRSGRPSPTVARYVIEDLDGLVDMIIDGGEVNIGLESTIIDLTGEVPTILRPGYVTQDMLTETLGLVDVDRTILDANSRQAPKAPGMKYRHYAPKGNLSIVEGEPERVVSYINERISALQKEGRKTGVIATDETVARYHGDDIKSVGSRRDEEVIARHLFRILREFDDDNVEVMFTESFETAGIGQAIMNRLLKAAGHQVIQV
ncbi:t(6)A37 threonylcarbamoyladenosine biosynthesis protein RimN [uncultured Clostridium sp.]|jgi:L-threonylcarbamoyladenylate synthase|nr:t(6)A37 threonylcarbamoyladenosine biosynthesis protein RimN [uncultured Clostridium sp.]